MDGTNTGQQGRVGRRTVAKGAAWAVPAVAVAGAAPAHAASGITTTTTTLPPCIDGIEATGGTYPVSVNLWGCQNPISNPNHWDFRLKFTVKASNCPYCKVQLRLWDNPRRSSLIYSPTFHHSGSRDPYYVESAAITPTAPGVPVVLPSTGQTVYQSNGASTGVTIEGDGETNDSLHALYSGGQAPGDPVPCGRDVALARYSIRYLPCGTGAQWGPWQGPFDVDPCIPMISATVCRVNSSTDRITVSVAQACGLSGSQFNLVQVRRSTSGDFPEQGSEVWGTGGNLAGGPVDIEVARSDGSGDFYWVEFHNGDPAIKSRLRIVRPGNNSTTCDPPPAAPVLSLVSNSNTCTSNTRTVTVSWTGTANRLQRSSNNTFDNGDPITTVSGNSHTYSFPDNSCNSDFWFRVYQEGFENFSNVLRVNDN